MKTKLNLRACTWRSSEHFGQLYGLYTNNEFEYSFSDFDFTTTRKIPTEWICVGLVKRCKGGIIHWIERKET